MSAIYINGQVFSLGQIKDRKYSNNNSYETLTLNFIADWLNGKDAFTIHTSGSTGNPKSIIHERTKMITSALMTARALGLQKGDNALVCLNTELIAGKMMLVRGLEIGMNLFIYPTTANPFLIINNNFKLDFAAMVPYQLQNALRDTPEKLSIINSMKALIIGGAAISSSLEEEIKKLTVPTYHTFGMTETISHIALRRLNGNERSDYYVTLDKISVDTDDRNCLIIESPYSDTPIVTNDIVEMKDSKTFKWLGRIDNVINSGGVKIHPEKVEATIERASPSLRKKRFFITSQPHQEFGEAVTILIEDKAWSESEIKKLKDELKQELSRFEIPKFYLFIEKFIETSSGKINRAATRQSFIAEK
jgi:O-succinylbenzoic acid--CoA ligase